MWIAGWRVLGHYLLVWVLHELPYLPFSIIIVIIYASVGSVAVTKAFYSVALVVRKKRKTATSIWSVNLNNFSDSFLQSESYIVLLCVSCGVSGCKNPSVIDHIY